MCSTSTDPTMTAIQPQFVLPHWIFDEVKNVDTSLTSSFVIVAGDGKIIKQEAGLADHVSDSDTAAALHPNFTSQSDRDEDIKPTLAPSPKHERLRNCTVRLVRLNPDMINTRKKKRVDVIVNHCLQTIKVTDTKISGSKRAYDNRKPPRPCLFCSSFFTHLPRHLKSSHKNEPEIETLRQLSAAEQSAAFTSIKKRGLIQNYVKSLKSGAKDPIGGMLKKGGKDDHKAVVCGHCFGFVRNMYKHNKAHTQTGCFTAFEIALPLLDPSLYTVGSDFRNAILRKFGENAAGSLCKTDFAVCALGNVLFRKLSDPTVMTRQVGRIMKKVAQVYLYYRDGRREECILQEPSSVCSPSKTSCLTASHALEQERKNARRQLEHSAATMLKSPNWSSFYDAIIRYVKSKPSECCIVRLSLYKIFRMMAVILKAFCIINDLVKEAADIDVFLDLLRLEVRPLFCNTSFHSEELKHVNVLASASFRDSLPRTASSSFTSNYPAGRAEPPESAGIGHQKHCDTDCRLDTTAEVVSDANRFSDFRKDKRVYLKYADRTVIAANVQGSRDAYKKKPPKPCLFCGKFKTSLSRHLKRRHGSEPEIKTFSERNVAVSKIKKRALIKYYIQTLRSGAQHHGARVLRSRGTLALQPTANVCGSCFGVFGSLRRHQVEYQVMCSSPLNVTVDLLHPDLYSFDGIFKHEVLQRFDTDAVGVVCMTDFVICALGNAMFRKKAGKGNLKATYLPQVRNIMRKAAQIYVYFQRSCGIFSAREPLVELERGTADNCGQIAEVTADEACGLRLSPAEQEAAIEMLDRSSAAMLKSSNWTFLYDAVICYVKARPIECCFWSGSIYNILRRLATVVKAFCIMKDLVEKAADVDIVVRMLDLEVRPLFSNIAPKPRVKEEIEDVKFSPRPMQLSADETSLVANKTVGEAAKSNVQLTVVSLDTSSVLESQNCYTSRSRVRSCNKMLRSRRNENAGATDIVVDGNSNMEATKKTKKWFRPHRPCIFCGLSRSKLSYHILRKHANKQEVKDIIALPLKERQLALRALRRQGMLEHNRKALITGDLLLTEREVPLKSTIMFSICCLCSGFFAKSDISRHQRTCSELKKVLRAAVNISQEFREEIFDRLKNDIIGTTCKSDTALVLYGQRLFDRRKSKRGEWRSQILSQLKMLARYFLKFRDLMLDKTGEPPCCTVASSLGFVMDDLSVSFLRQQNYQRSFSVLDMTRRENLDVLKETFKQYHGIDDNERAYFRVLDLAKYAKQLYLENGDAEKLADVETFVKDLGMFYHSRLDLVRKRSRVNKRCYVCYICSLTFARPMSLVNHINHHMDDKSFICSTCGQQFKTAGNLHVHEHSHSGLQSYSPRPMPLSAGEPSLVANKTVGETPKSSVQLLSVVSLDTSSVFNPSQNCNINCEINTSRSRVRSCNKMLRSRHQIVMFRRNENAGATDVEDNSNMENTKKTKKWFRPHRPCIFCGLYRSKLSYHILRKHADKQEVKDIIALPLKERQLALRALRRQGMLEHNRKALITGDLLLTERKVPLKSTLMFSICSLCSGFFAKSDISRHQRTCSELKKVQRAAVNISQEFREEIFDRLKNDIIGTTCKSDTALVLYGQRLFDRRKSKRGEWRSQILSQLKMLAQYFVKFRDLMLDKTGEPPCCTVASSLGFVMDDLSVSFLRQQNCHRSFSVLDMTRRENLDVLKETFKQYHGIDDNERAYFRVLDLAKYAKQLYLENGDAEKLADVETFVKDLGMFYHSRLDLVRKRNRDNKRCYVCYICGLMFARPMSLVSHINHHTDDKSFICSTCGQQFKTAGNLRVHERSHSGLQPYTCADCGRHFAQIGSLKVHMRIHSGERPYVCQECGKGFTHSGNLNVHLRIHLGGIKPFKCDKCDKSFTHSGNLKVHSRTHENVVKPYKCSECNKSFAHSGNLKVHSRSHSKHSYESLETVSLTTKYPNDDLHDSSGRCSKADRTKPTYSCGDCGRDFSQLGALRIHSRTHTGEKPFECPICDKGFTHSGNLKVHFRTHSRARPYSCKSCGMKFSQSSSLHTHKTLLGHDSSDSETD